MPLPECWKQQADSIEALQHLVFATVLPLSDWHVVRSFNTVIDSLNRTPLLPLATIDPTSTCSVATATATVAVGDGDGDVGSNSNESRVYTDHNVDDADDDASSAVAAQDDFIPLNSGDSSNDVPVDVAVAHRCKVHVIPLFEPRNLVSGTTATRTSEPSTVALASPAAIVEHFSACTRTCDHTLTQLAQAHGFNVRFVPRRCIAKHSQAPTPSSRLSSAVHQQLMALVRSTMVGQIILTSSSQHAGGGGACSLRVDTVHLFEAPCESHVYSDQDPILLNAVFENIALPHEDLLPCNRNMAQLFLSVWSSVHIGNCRCWCCSQLWCTLYCQPSEPVANGVGCTCVDSSAATATGIYTDVIKVCATTAQLVVMSSRTCTP
jgi:hypothetical protein